MDATIIDLFKAGNFVRLKMNPYGHVYKITKATFGVLPDSCPDANVRLQARSYIHLTIEPYPATSETARTVDANEVISAVTDEPIDFGDMVKIKNDPSNQEYIIIGIGSKSDGTPIRYTLGKYPRCYEQVFTSVSADSVDVLVSRFLKDIYCYSQRLMPIKLDNGARMPEKAHEYDAGFDLFAPRDCDFIDGECVIDTGVHVAIPRGYVGYIQGRSGLNMRESIICPTGTVDSGYTGSIKVKLYNLSLFSHYTIKAGDKIAQLVVQPIANYSFVQVDSLENTERGDGGFGSTGR